MSLVYRATEERPDGITITVAIAVPNGTDDALEFSELAQAGLVQASRVVTRSHALRERLRLEAVAKSVDVPF